MSNLIDKIDIDGTEWTRTDRIREILEKVEQLQPHPGHGHICGECGYCITLSETYRNRKCYVSPDEPACPDFVPCAPEALPAEYRTGVGWNGMVKKEMDKEER